MIEFVEYWHQRTQLSMSQLLKGLELDRRKYYKWKERFGIPNQHNAPLPKVHWLEPWEKEAILIYYVEHPLEGYRRLSFMMLDEDIVAVSPSSVYRVLKVANFLNPGAEASKKGTGFKQPLSPHEHWHVDIAYINICGTFYYLCSSLDGYSRYVVHWEIREQMTEADVEIIIQRAKEKFPSARPRIISDNGPQFIAKDFKEFVKISGMTHVRTSPFYPQSNGKIERWHQSLKKECIRPKTPTSLQEAQRIVKEFVDYYNQIRLHSAIGYIAPMDKLNGKEKVIFGQRKQKLLIAQQRRKKNFSKEQPRLICG